MKMGLGLFLFTITNAVLGQSPEPKFSLTLSLPQSVMRTGSNIEVDIAKKNISDQDMTFVEVVGSAEEDYDVIITDPDGKPTAETKYGRRLHGKEPYIGHHRSEFIGSLKPGETLQQHIFVNRIYDLTRPGKYTIQVQQSVYASEADVKAQVKTDVKSNTVTVTVTN